jgi:hypothetical protein
MELFIADVDVVVAKHTAGLIGISFIFFLSCD